MKKIKAALSLIRFSKRIVLFCLTFVTVYTVVAIAYQWISGTELSPTLTDRVYTCLISELTITGLLKVAEGVIESLKYNKEIKSTGISSDESAFIPESLDENEYNDHIDNVINDIRNGNNIGTSSSGYSGCNSESYEDGTVDYSSNNE